MIGRRGDRDKMTTNTSNLPENIALALLRGSDILRQVKRAVIAVSTEWVKAGHVAFLDPGFVLNPEDQHHQFAVFIEDEAHVHGLKVKQMRDAPNDADATILIPWNYVKSIVWIRDFDDAKAKLGFKPNQHQPREAEPKADVPI
jgi:hypothetical protein